MLHAILILLTNSLYSNFSTKQQLEQDGATSHVAKASMQRLLPVRGIYKRGGIEWSQDRQIWWGYLRSKAFTDKKRDIRYRTMKIQQVTASIPLNMLHHVMQIS